MRCVTPDSGEPQDGARAHVSHATQTQTDTHNGKRQFIATQTQQK